MKVVVTITLELDGPVQRAGFSLYDRDGSMLASETSTGWNVTNRTPVALVQALIRQAELVAADLPDPSEEVEPY